MSDNYLALLGTKGGPSVRPGSTMPTSSLLCLDGRLIVVDCGLGVTRGLVDQGMRLESLSLIFITHLHSDHYLELGPLIHTAWTTGLKTPVVIYGPEGLASYWDAFLTSMEADIVLRIEDEGRKDLRSLVEIRTIDAGTIHDEPGLSVTAMRVEHPPLVDSFALRFAAGGREVVMSGDTAYLPALADFAGGADLLLHEAMLGSALPALVARVGTDNDKLMQHLVRSHTTAEDAARIAAEAGVGALALNHLIPSDDPDYTADQWHEAVRPHWSGGFHLGRDGLRIPL
jgi:ribonuclease BN (tRNA processing enzyme)